MDNASHGCASTIVDIGHCTGNGACCGDTTEDG